MQQQNNNNNDDDNNNNNNNNKNNNNSNNNNNIKYNVHITKNKTTAFWVKVYLYVCLGKCAMI